MPIKGLTDRGCQFPVIGQIRKGAPKTENKPGADLQYFRVTFDEKEETRYAKFIGAYGTTPNEINILLPFNEIDRVWSAWYEAYTAGRMVARSDGEYFTYLLDTKTGALLTANGEKIPHREIVGTYVNRKTGRDEPIKMKPVGRLMVVIPELQSLAYLTVLTTSIHDIKNISEQLDAIYQLTGGRIAGIPLVLRRRPKKISTPGANGERARYAKWLISIEADQEWTALKFAALNEAALPSVSSRLALPEPVATDTEPEDDSLPWENEEDGEFSESESEQVSEPEPESSKPSAMTYETACKAADRHGNLYSNVDTAKLSYVANSLQKSLDNNGLTPEEHEDKMFKLAAIKVILAHRQSESTATPSCG